MLLTSPAKLNLYLRVINKRPDGFHNIATVFERINLHDEIVLTSRSDGKIKIICQHPDVPLDDRNIAYKIAATFQRDFEVSQGVTIDIRKKIPVAAGMAGGSSNGATVLMGLNELWQLKLSQKQQLSYAAALGSDVSFFVHQIPLAFGSGRGEVIVPIKKKIALWHVIVVPKMKMFTWKVYGKLGLKPDADPTRNGPFPFGKKPEIGQRNLLTKINDDVNILLHHLGKNCLDDARTKFINDLEIPVFKLCPRLLSLKENLSQRISGPVMLSGSGPSVYATVASEAEANFLAEKMKKRYRQVYVACTA